VLFDSRSENGRKSQRFTGSSGKLKGFSVRGYVDFRSIFSRGNIHPLHHISKARSLCA
jgi:hypothetical protein